MVINNAVTPTQTPTQAAPRQPKIGNQDYPANPAMDEWAKTAEYPTVPKFFRMAVAKNPDGPYVGAKVGKEYQYRTYKEVEKQVEQFSSALIQNGIKPGDRVSIFAENSPDWRVADLGIAYTGAVLGTLLTEYPDNIASYVMKDSGSKMLVVDNKARLEQMIKLEKDLPDLQTIVVTGDVDLKSIQSTKKLISLKDFMAQGAESMEANRPEMEKRIQDEKATDIGSIVYTSGSTGNPKGVLLSHGNVLASVESMLRNVDDNPNESLKTIRRDDLYAAILPLGHVMGRVADYTLTAEGGKIAYPAGLLAFQKDLPELKPTIVAVTPLFFQKIYEKAEKKALKEKGPVVPPVLAGLVAGGAGAALGAVGGALAGVGLGGAGLAWGLGIAGGVLGGVAADELATNAAGKLTKAGAFQKAVNNSKEFYESHGTASVGTTLGHLLAEKTVFAQVRKELDAGTGGRARVRISGGASLPAEAETLVRGAGYHIAQGYGLSETAGGGLMNNPEHAQLGTGGKPLPGLKVRLAEDGELQILSPTTMTGGYLNQQEKTQESFTADHYYRTGDTAKVVPVVDGTSPWKLGAATGASTAIGAAIGSALGHPVVGAALAGLAGAAGTWASGLAAHKGEDHYVIVGRIKSQFKLPGGEYVTPEPIEDDLRGSPYIAEAVLTGAKDRDLVGAVIVPKFDNLKAWAKEKGLPTDPKELLKQPAAQELFLNEATSRSQGHNKFEVVRAVAVLDHDLAADERTAGTNKVVRNKVLDHYSAQIDTMFKA